MWLSFHYRSRAWVLNLFHIKYPFRCDSLGQYPSEETKQIFFWIFFANWHHFQGGSFKAALNEPPFAAAACDVKTPSASKKAKISEVDSPNDSKDATSKSSCSWNIRNLQLQLKYTIWMPRRLPKVIQERNIFSSICITRRLTLSHQSRIWIDRWVKHHILILMKLLENR